VPPALREDHSKEIQQIGEDDGVPVWILSPPGDFPRDYFRDGFHLNAHGSDIFTSRLAQQIRAMQGVRANCKSCGRSAVEMVNGARTISR
jgi:hypothetical protein